jgi:hypothetical protein
MPVCRRRGSSTRPPLSAESSPLTRRRLTRDPLRTHANQAVSARRSQRLRLTQVVQLRGPRASGYRDGVCSPPPTGSSSAALLEPRGARASLAPATVWALTVSRSLMSSHRLPPGRSASSYGHPLDPVGAGLIAADVGAGAPCRSDGLRRAPETARTSSSAAPPPRRSLPPPSVPAPTRRGGAPPLNPSPRTRPVTAPSVTSSPRAWTGSRSRLGRPGDVRQTWIGTGISCPARRRSPRSAQCLPGAAETDCGAPHSKRETPVDTGASEYRFGVPLPGFEPGFPP